MRIIFLFLFLFILPNAALADVWQVRGHDSHIHFRVTEAGKLTTGSFPDFKSEIYFAPDDLENSRVAVTVNLRAIEYPSAEGRQALHTSDWFDTAVHESARFLAEKFEHTQGDDYIAYGMLTIKDVSIPYELPFTLEVSGDVARMSATNEILRLNFNLGQGDWANTDFIGNAVLLDIAIVADRMENTP